MTKDSCTSARLDLRELGNQLRASGLSDEAVNGALGRLREVRDNGMITGRAWGGQFVDAYWKPVGGRR